VKRTISLENSRDTLRSNELKSRILQAAREQPSPTRKQVASRSAIILATAIAGPIVGLVLVGGAHRGPRPLSLLLATVGGGLLLALVATWISVGRGGQMLGRARVWLLSVAAATPLFWVVWKEIWSREFTGMAAPWAGRPGLRCFALTLALALVPLFSLAAVRRASDPAHPRSLGAALGVAAGMYAAVMVDLWCPVGDLRHVLFGHALPVILLGLVGVAIGYRVLAIRRRR
jgi:hypothetical protein